MKLLHIAPFILAAELVAMVACGERTHRAPAGESVTAPTVEQQPKPVVIPTEPAASETVAPATTTKEKTKPASQSATHSVAHNDMDNLRGWDPALEDDTQDNGMRRYMKNDDDEGWE